MTDRRPSHRILIIDDNRAIHDDFEKILCQNEVDDDLALAEAAFLGDDLDAGATVKYELDHAFQGEEGLGLVQQAQREGMAYDLAFVDMRMPPGWDGVETIEKLWEVEPALQVVICTAYSDYTWGEIARRLGLNDRLLILKKPFDNAEVSQIAAAMTAKRFNELENAAQQQVLQAELRERDEKLLGCVCQSDD